MKRPRAKTRNLRESCVLEALAIIGETGIEELSLREVARRLGVSHQAPYKHFPSRDHLLAEIVSRAFAAFAQHLDARRRSQNPHEDLAAMGRAYLDYAREHPLHYRLMFGTPLPDPDQHPEMMRSAQHAFSLLRDCLTQMFADPGNAAAKSAVELDALFVWSTMHGLASILQTSAIRTLALPSAVLAATASHTLQRIGVALSTQGDQTLTKERAF
jgi:AcrR family transcriptional regulator